MKEIFKKYLFSKRYFVSENAPSENQFETIFYLANSFGIEIVKNAHLADVSHIQLSASELGINIPEPFYRHFPQSVLKLTPDQLLFDQLVHYTVTYGFGCFEEPGHSVFKEEFDKLLPLKEIFEKKQFEILPVEQAEKVLLQCVQDLVGTSRPLNLTQYQVVLNYVADYGYDNLWFVGKNTVIKLLVDLRKIKFAKYLVLSDVLKVVEQLLLANGQAVNLKQLNLRNQDRKFITKLLDFVFAFCRCNTLECYERQAIWCGLLHHLHYKGQNSTAVEFVNAMRTKGNKSVYAQMERYLAEGNVKDAVKCLQKGKGSGAVLRNLNYLLSRCNVFQVNTVLKAIQSDNVVLLLQLMFSYANYPSDESERTFKFVRFNNLVTHVETEDERLARKSRISPKLAKRVASAIQKLLKEKLANRLGKVYVDKKMKYCALPMQEGASMGGLGVMAKGSKIPLDLSQKIRAFVYWEKVSDIDLSVIGLTEKGEQKEFSWRTMYANQSNAITFSGDQTSGFYGGSEYFDVDAREFVRMHPNIRYLVFCSNVYSGVSYSQIVCRAGYMLRDVEENGEIFEPSTVQSAYKVDGDDMFQVLFALDLKENNFIWMNLSLQVRSRVAGLNDLSFLFDYFGRVEVMSLADFVTLMATEVVDNPNDADVVVSDQFFELSDDKQVIRSYDFEKITALMK